KNQLVAGESSIVHLVHNSREAIASIAYWTVGAEVLFVSFTTKLEDGTWIATRNHKHQLDLPPMVRVDCLPGETPEKTWEAHMRKTVLNHRGGGRAVRIGTTEDFEKMCDEFEIGEF